ncbi:helix-turn-helix transcriptional regulator [uncultured Chryseobacterium sp.]|uniref:helix-turn-helix domain-containing protein n=1 Tax=uncultured Chryseobacterium sp. TaxID=259322 RepID=UPI00258BB07B|nr:helix-turn-helix transcriptional regulator [uncultured Chryseobacterium sp.]
MQYQRIKTISDYHKLMGLPGPQHPLISLVNFKNFPSANRDQPLHIFYDFYAISVKRDFDLKMKYGHSAYDFEEGVMFFIATGQLFSIEANATSHIKHAGWTLLIHPDFLWNTPLAKGIRKYEFFDYKVNESLFISEKEESVIISILENIDHEYNTHIDTFSQQIIISQIETLLSYSERFYQRQFITRKKANQQILGRLEEILEFYFEDEVKSLPSVQFVAEQLHLSSSYLNNMLKTITGLSTQQHIHEKLIEKAKVKLSTTELSISEIAYELGFEHPQSFSKLFKSKTSQTPLQFRAGFH